ncbi:MAG: hypothetical protein QGI51_00110 [Dehalococcoidales bacterium]|nr:hypothetical protein [Dehalococcoidales bacterium]MDP6631892.1 hypothetical protein [Dehalococcoidales bacterium]
MGVFITYGVSLIAARWVSEDGPEAGESKLVDWNSKVLGAYSRLFHFEKLFSETIIESPAALISNWLGMTWRLTRVVVPLLVIFSVIAVYIVQVMPDSGNNITDVAVTAIFATLLMIPTWTEVPLAVGLINNGLTGIAAVMLITLPAVSIPGLLITAGAVRSLKVALILGLSVLIAGILAGIIFL